MMLGVELQGWYTKCIVSVPLALRLVIPHPFSDVKLPPVAQTLNDLPRDVDLELEPMQSVDARLRTDARRGAREESEREQTGNLRVDSAVRVGVHFFGLDAVVDGQHSLHWECFGSEQALRIAFEL